MARVYQSITFLFYSLVVASYGHASITQYTRRNSSEIVGASTPTSFVYSYSPSNRYARVWNSIRYLLSFNGYDKETIFVALPGKAAKDQPKVTGANKIGDGETFDLVLPEPIEGLETEYNVKEAIADMRGTVKSALQMMYKDIPKDWRNC